LLVAPLAGTFESGNAAIGDDLQAGAVIGRVVTKREAQEVIAQYDATLVEWLVENGDPVSPGQPLARIHPQVSA
jgi:[acyl-carrier-protein] S-malonyltransferase